MQSEAYQSISKALGGVSCAGSGGGSTRRCCVGLSMQNRRSALAAVRVPLSASTSYSKSRPRPRPTAFSQSHWHCAGRRVEATLEGLNFNSFAGERASARALRILGQHLARIQCGCHCTILHLLLIPPACCCSPTHPVGLLQLFYCRLFSAYICLELGNKRETENATGVGAFS